jgi:hypothetical protein
MTELLRENRLYMVELDQDTSQDHLPHRSWGTYKVLDRTSTRVLYITANRDKSFGVFEFVSQEAGLR